jgi:predicted naringenin-chalcone synthase
VKFSLRGFGTATPPHSVAQADAVLAAQTFCCATDQERQWLKLVYLRSGIERRFSVLLENGEAGIEGRQSFYPPQQGPADRGPTTALRMQRYEAESPGLARQAAGRALADAGWLASSITHLVTVSCSGFASPGFDFALIRDLGLRPDVSRTHVGFMGCHGALIGLRTAGMFARAEPESRVLLCAVELCTLHQQYGFHQERIVANGLFADGAAAVVGQVMPRFDPGWGILRHETLVLTNSEECMGWRIGDHGFEMKLTPDVPVQIAQSLGNWLDRWLVEVGLRRESIATWAVHPGGPRILTATREALSLPEQALAVSHETLRDYGNMSSPTILFILEKLRRQQAPLPCVALAFGPGLSMEAALIV